MKKQKIIIDTDPGHDDVLAIMLLVKSNLFEIEGITTVAGNSDIQNVTNNARYVIDLLEKNILLYSGSEKPLKREFVKAVVHGKGGLAGADVKKKEFLNNLAVEKIIEIVRKNPKKVSIVALGPQTNIAKAFLKDKKLPELIKEVVIMGGTFNAPGNKSRVAEFNVFVDPEAAEIVFNSRVKKVIVPLDVCNNIFFKLDDFNKLKSTKLYKPLSSMMKEFLKGISSDEGVERILVYDALSAYYLINPKAFLLEKADVKIETRGKFTSGMTVVEARKKVKKEFNVKIVRKIDKEEFMNDFINILKN